MARQGVLKKTAVRRKMIHLFLIPFTVIWIYPFLWMVSASLKNPHEMFLGGLNLIPHHITFENFIRAWNEANFAGYFLNTTFVTVVDVILVILISAMAGYALGRGSMPGKAIFLLVLVATMFLPKGYTIIPIFEIMVFLGLDNSLASVILTEAGHAHIVAILLFMGYFSQLPGDLEESARIDGAGFHTTFFRIMFPISKPVIATVAIFNFIGAWNSFLVPLVFTLTTPALRTLGVGMYAFYGEHTIDWTGLAAGAVISVVPIIIVFLFLQKYFIEGLAGSIKG